MIIKIRKPQNLQALYVRAKNDAAKRGIKCTGDMHKGHGMGFGFEGRYTVGVDSITITVLKKPLLVSKSRIESVIKRYIGQT